MSWCWHQRLGGADPGDGSLPPTTDACAENLDWVRYHDLKQRFLTEDPAANYLSERLSMLSRPASADGYWGKVVASLELDDPSCFLLALALAQRLDSGLDPVFATCMNDLSRPYATLALAQRLWDDPLAMATVAGDRRLFQLGVLRQYESQEGQPEWQQPLDMPATVAMVLAGLNSPASAGGLEPLKTKEATPHKALKIVSWRLARRRPESLEILPLVGPAGADYDAAVQALNGDCGSPLLRVPSRITVNQERLFESLTLAWLADADLLLAEELTSNTKPLEQILIRCRSIPVRCFLPIQDRQSLKGLPASLLLPEVRIEGTGYEERLQLLSSGLGGSGERLRETVQECARRFRLQAPSVRRLTDSLRDYPDLDAETLINACRLEAQGDMGHLAQRVIPRFTIKELILPSPQARQFQEVGRAMHTLTRVHYQWGTAKAWNEGGLAVLFCGPPGTGKTMAAEAQAQALDLDLYRIDLSQVVNKYIGETEKNLKKVFDAAEASDCVLFFDEADALFGKRTDVKDAHDRFANIEISYLLERMEHFKGLAILATNRRKDLDEAFLRRLRYIIEFPVPGPLERERIWRMGFPTGVDTLDLDFRYLAKQFVLSGGHIRSIIFNACLQAAHRMPSTTLPTGKVGSVGMVEVLVQVKRELQKINRAVGEEQFGAYASEVLEWSA
ncbi:MAG: ATP-binding protein [Candidatus Thiodiazotropha sp. L084R]